MAVITFPRAFPAGVGLIGVSFKLVPQLELTPLRSGRQIAADLGPSLWLASYRSAGLTEAQLGKARSWFDTLSSLNELYGYDVLRQYPLAYRATGWAGLTVGIDPFSGIAKLGTVPANNVEAPLTALPVGFVLSEGDYLAFDYGSADEYRALHRICAGATANGSGQATVEVRPHVRTGWEANADVILYRPAARMLVVPDSYDEAVGVDRNGTFSFQAIQTL